MNEQQLKEDFFNKYEELQNWETDFDQEQIDSLEARRVELMKSIEGDPMANLEYVRIRLSQVHSEFYKLFHKIPQYVKNTRDRNTKIMNRQYGVASDTIHRQRGEIAQLKLKLQEGKT